MRRSLVQTLLPLAILSFASGASAEKPTRIQIGQIGKAATACIESGEAPLGAAFCVHASGLFVTTWRLAGLADKEQFQLVLNPTLKTQKVLRARLLRRDKDLDAGLIRVDTERAVPALPLGSDEGVVEGAEVVVLGFSLAKPEGRANDHSPVLINRGRVKSLERPGSKLEGFQIDTSLGGWGTGGPVLDAEGKVIGMLTTWPDSNKRTTLPVSYLARFLKTPTVYLTLPELTRAGLGKPAEFRASVVSFTPKAPAPSVRLVLNVNGRSRELEMKRRGDEYVASATVFEGGTPDGELKATATAVAIVDDKEVARFETDIIPVR
jgi:hypothetical protein